MDYDRNDALLHWLFRQTQGDAWFRPNEENISSGVALRVASDEFRVFPYENANLEPFETAVSALNPVVAVKVRSAAVHAALGEVAADEKSIYVDAETRIQILETMLMLPQADKEQCAAFIRDERVLVIWSESLDHIIPICHDFEERLIKLLWRSRPLAAAPSSSYNTTNVSSAGSAVDVSGSNEAFARGSIARDGDEEEEKVAAEKSEGGDVEAPERRRRTTRTWYGRKIVIDDDDGLEDAEGFRGEERRKIKLYSPLYSGLAAGAAVVFVGNGVRTLLVEWTLDGDFIRFALLAAVPLLYCVSLFFALQIIQNLTMAIGPIAHYHENSKYYSAIKPRPDKELDNNLPHITIQMPVYKESLDAVLAPSIKSLKKAMHTYARQGGTSTIFINDDGLRLLPAHQRDERLAFYANHNIGWVARPKHDATPGGFKRAGRFKKASNMNYGLALSLKAEKHLETLLANSPNRISTSSNTHNRSLRMAIEETWEESGRRWRPWAANGRATRIGEILLLVDSDTVVPEDCLRDAAREMKACPTVAIIQHESDVMQVAHHYFENGIAYFTKRINRCISMACANGEVAPFMGHNAFLRWKAIQDALFVDPVDGKEKIWSESNVSEDFDMALRLMLKGYIIRWATYSKGAFKEGVSLSVDDEFNRWQKYAYGCNEMLFNPIIQWWRKGPISRQIHRFLWSKAPIHYKISMLAYMFSYYGLAGSITISIINYVLLGFQFPVDGFFMHSFEIWLATTAVFWGSGTIGYTLLEYRLGHKKLLYALFENLMWIPFFFFFFAGLSIPISQAILAHLFSYNIQWSATIKEVQLSNFFIEIPKIARRFWFPFLLSIAIIAGMIILATPLVPLDWRVGASGWAVIFPLALSAGCHILFPIVLNPWLMVFSY
ncbi:uncharacterized protein LACBIDRAFT_192205 [Laccaria bicolor S238N-H82]|uniref:Uncharacterized protein n=1 Tax=Laccaria bicolor (strain S238N-H82 / ATCC MYA-4686) TaxID=486041 RepID=B0DZZ6_LACBS|nr:uncharacterized protein LACBIDRAFT_192205 [Laccaria bicolor S238N-H82]EDQ99846.1 hypothetical protein LACBIDRAFT_192205 [Laccaria bicolor S238N-H82]|eukprot:XP_001889538.1 hypothetical protein LACBIDRAFT_192205 [Laccaria bicolor S238N-H82]